MPFSFFKKDIQEQHTQAQIISLIKSFALSSQSMLFENINLYHQKEFFTLPLLLFVPEKGMLLFEPIDWYREDLQSATVSPWLPSSKHSRSIHIDTPLDLINQKFNYILHQDLNITTGLILFENLSESEFDSLDSSFHRLIPKSRALFCNESMESLTQKVNDALSTISIEIDATTVLSSLFMQYTLMADDFNPSQSIVDEAQQHYIDADFLPCSTLIGPYGCGKSSVMLLKVLSQLLKYPKQKIMIIAPTHAACEILKRKMLEIIEYAIINLDLSTIEVITPKELLARHAKQIYNKPLEPIKITDKMMSKTFNAAEVVICDDAELFSDEFIAYLLHIQKKRYLHLIGVDCQNAVGEPIVLSQSYRFSESLINLCTKDLNDKHSYETVPNVKFSVGNIYMQTILAFKEVLNLRDDGEKCLIITPSSSFAHALYEEMHEYIEEKIILFNAKESIASESFHHHMIVPQNDMASLQKKHVIVSGIDPNNKKLFCYAMSRSSETVHVVLGDDNFHDTNLELEEYF